MSHTPHARLIAPLLALISIFALASASQAETSRRRALLIGVNNYQSVPHLNGALNDIAMIREILISRFEFDAADIALLRDKEATRKGILDALDALATRSQPGDTIYIHYSGHGSQVHDNNGDELDGLDETLVPHDGRTPGIPDITDDELGELFARLRGDSVIVTLDSCHSGTATRSARALRARTIPADTRNELYLSTRTRAVVPLVTGEHLLMAGAASHQEALDGPVDGRPYGLFSYALAQSLAHAPANTSPRGLFRFVRGELERIKGQLGLANMPEPQLEGLIDRLDSALFPVANDTETPRLAWLPAKKMPSGEIELKAGVALGAIPGSTWALYGPNETRFEPGSAIGEALVTRVSGEHSIARAEPANLVFEGIGRAVAIAPAPIDDRVSIHWVDPDPKRAIRVKDRVRASLPAVNYVDASEFARFVVVVEGQTAHANAADATSEIARYPIEDEEQLGRSLATLFARSITAAELLSISNASAELTLDLEVVGHSPLAGAPNENPLAETIVASSAAPTFSIRQAGEPRTASNSLQIAVEASESCSLVAIDVDTEGGVAVLFPNAVSEARGFIPGGRISDGERVSIPDSLAPENSAGFHLDYVPPAGTDTIRAFCFRSAGAAHDFRAAVVRLESQLATRSADPVSDRVAVRDVLLGQLAPAMTRAASRGVAIVAASDEKSDAEAVESTAEANAGELVAENFEPSAARADWTAASVTLAITE